jgi:glycosyltransferase involved in cell wall biosynthesis
MPAQSQVMVVANIIEEARWGGPQKRITEIAQRAVQKGIKTIVILPKKDNEVFVSKLEENGVPYCVIDLAHRSRRLVDILFYILTFPVDILKLWIILKQHNVNLVHCNGAPQWKGIIAAMLAGKAVLWHLNNTRADRLSHFIFGCLQSFATGFILASERSARYYLKGGSTDQPRFLIQAPVDCDYFNLNQCDRSGTRSSYCPLKIGSVGNINPDKDILTYVRMARLLRSQLGDGVACFHVGARFESQKAYAAVVDELNGSTERPYVTMLGASNDVRSFLCDLDIYVCSSAFEASPMSVWEAMAMGLPIVVTDVGDIAEMNEQGDFARVVKVGDEAALAEAVRGLVESPKERVRLGTNARRYAEKHLDIATCVERHCNAYRDILKHKTT